MKRAVVALLALFALAATATTVVPMSLEELTTAASRIVEGQAVKSWSTWNAQRTLIYTYTTFRVSRNLKGGEDPTVTIRQLGGSAGGYTQKVSGLRHPQIGEEELLFLRASEAGDGSMAVVGLMQGQFRVYQTAAGDTLVSNGVNGASVVDRSTGRISTFRGTPMRLVDAEARIKRSLTQ